MRNIDLPASQQAQLETLLIQFDEDWNGQSLIRALGRCAHESIDYRQIALQELIKVDLERHWSAGTEKRIDEYQGLLAGVGLIGDIPTELILAEFVARHESGKKPAANDYRERFPGQFEKFLELLQQEKSRRSGLRKSDLKEATGSVEKSSQQANQENSSQSDERTFSTDDSKPSHSIGDQNTFDKEASASSNPAKGTQPQSPADPHSLPETFGRYKIQKRLGAGAMGAVYLAKDTQLDRLVALKTPTFGGNKNKQIVERFYREARAAANLRNPNICPVFDVGEIDGRHYITMAFIKGRPLSDYVGQTLDQKTVASITRKLALALAEAHGEGVIHRDLKPANIMVDKKRRPLVMDFGLARREDEGESRMTQNGTIMGTPAYMSPEQVKGDIDDVDAQADIYSLGIILYELLTGQVPFDGPVAAVIGQVLTEAPRLPIDLRHDVDPDLQTICLKMILKKKSDRYQSMHAVAKDLGNYLKGKSVTRESKPAIEAVPLLPVKVAAESPSDMLPVLDGIMDDLALPPMGTEAIAPAAAKKLRHQKKFNRGTPWKASNGRYAKWGLPVVGVTSAVFLALLIAAIGFKVFPLKYSKNITTWPTEQPLKESPEIADQPINPENNQADKSELSSSTKKKSSNEKLGDDSPPPSKDTAKAKKSTAYAPDLKADINSVPPEDYDDSLISSIVNQFGLSAPKEASFPFNASVAREHQENWADFLGVEVEYTNSIGIEFVLIPPGVYLMGDVNSGSNNQTYQVAITKPFYIAKYETTQEDFEKVMDWNPSIWQGKGKGPWIDAIAEHARMELTEVDTSRYPIEQVSWLEAQAFCDALSRLESNGETYRLPTEAEWEYACRAGTQTDFFWGNDPKDVNQYGWVGLNSGTEPITSLTLQRILEDWSAGEANWTLNHQPTEVGTKLPNAWGMFDTIGNVGEWCSDWYEAYPTKPSIDPQGPTEGELKIIRGGDYISDPTKQTNVWGRNRYSPAGKANNTGFRLVREIPRTSGIRSTVESQKPALAKFPFDPAEAKNLQQAWKRYLGLPQRNFTNDLGMEFVLIPPGEFLMGIYQGPRHQHRVRINRPFYISTTEVTQGEYREMVGSNPSITAKGDNLPVNNVTWNEANNFCQKLCQGNKYKYRLPTEAEWTYVHRAGSFKRFWFGDNPIALKKDLNQYAINAHNSGRQITDVEAKYFSDPTLRDEKYRDYLNSIGCKPRDVKSKPSNPFGVYDMEGNLSEWCLDRFSTDYFRKSPLNDPRGPLQGTDYVLRGSNFLDFPRTFSPWRRGGLPASFKTDHIGFRVVVEIPEEYLDRSEPGSN